MQVLLTLDKDNNALKSIGLENVFTDYVFYLFIYVLYLFLLKSRPLLI